MVTNSGVNPLSFLAFTSAPAPSSSLTTSSNPPLPEGREWRVLESHENSEHTSNVERRPSEAVTLIDVGLLIN